MGCINVPKWYITRKQRGNNGQRKTGTSVFNAGEKVQINPAAVRQCVLGLVDLRTCYYDEWPRRYARKGCYEEAFETCCVQAKQGCIQEEEVMGFVILYAWQIAFILSICFWTLILTWIF